MASDSPPPVSKKSPFLPPRWVIKSAWAIHRALYRWSRGRFGLRKPSEKTYGLAQLTTIGRRSGERRNVMIGYYHEGESLVTMAMNGWDSSEPAWWLNLQAQPLATVTLGDVELSVKGRAAVGDERERLWARWREYDAQLDGWASRRSGETAVVVLTPIGDG